MSLKAENRYEYTADTKPHAQALTEEDLYMREFCYAH